MANIVTPLGALVARLQKNGSLSDHDREMVAQQIQRLNAMLRRITSFGRPQAQLHEVVDVNEVVAATVSMIETDAINRHIELATNLALGSPTVVADPSGLQQSLVNLILNALDACLEGSRVVVSTGVEHGDVSIAVADNGSGIPADLQPHLFEPFFTTKKQGTGLGLYSVRRIVQQDLGGVVQIDSTEGEGTTVCMILLRHVRPRPVLRACGELSAESVRLTFARRTARNAEQEEGPCRGGPASHRPTRPGDARALGPACQGCR